MSGSMTWWGRLARWCAAVGAGIGLALLAPAVAWASASPGTLAVADEVARRRPRLGGGVFGGLGLLCCLAVIVIVVLIVVLSRRRR
ncbi:MAG TPA: hypothetical protein VFT95_13155 [Micromonosporaceae bacterium]|nr:hypothetical protein [Micromonosporaceae bacterium]